MTEKFPFQKCFLSRKSNKADIASNLIHYSNLRKKRDRAMGGKNELKKFSHSDLFTKVSY